MQIPNTGALPLRINYHLAKLQVNISSTPIKISAPKKRTHFNANTYFLGAEIFEGVVEIFTRILLEDR